MKITIENTEEWLELLINKIKRATFDVLEHQYYPPDLLYIDAETYYILRRLRHNEIKIEVSKITILGMEVKPLPMVEKTLIPTYSHFRLMLDQAENKKKEKEKENIQQSLRTP